MGESVGLDGGKAGEGFTVTCFVNGQLLLFLTYWYFGLFQGTTIFKSLGLGLV